MRKLYAPILVLAMALGIIAAASPATAQPPDRSSVQGQIAQILRDHPGGVQISPTQIAWQNGAAILNLQPPSHGATPNLPFDGCPDGYYCFFALKNFGGRMLQLSTCNSTQIFFSNYGFENLASSWVVNRNIHYLNVYEVIDPVTYWNYLWSEPAYAAQSYVGTVADNRADMVECFPN